MVMRPVIVCLIYLISLNLLILNLMTCGCSKAKKQEAQNPLTQVEQLKQEANNGNLAAAFELGKMLINGTNTEKDLTNGISWIEKAANGGHAKAMEYMGFLYETGPGVEPSLTKALDWYQKSYKAGNTNVISQINKIKDSLALEKARQDEEIEKQHQEAIKKETLEIYNEGVRLASGDGTQQDLSKAAELFKKAAERGFGPAQYNLAMLLLTGSGVEKNVVEAERLLKLAADQDYPEAQYSLAVLYAKGEIDGKPDFKKAAEWAEKAAAHGKAEAQYNLGILYATGHGVPQDDAKAAEWFKKAAEQGHPIAQSNLGVFYVKGRGVKQDFKEALKWFLLAAEQGNPVAQYNLGIFYQKGQGVDRDPAEAYKWTLLAAEQGDQDAIQNRDYLAMELSPKDIAEGIRRATSFVLKKFTNSTEFLLSLTNEPDIN